VEATVCQELPCSRKAYGEVVLMMAKTQVYWSRYEFYLAKFTEITVGSKGAAEIIGTQRN
jgi:hypothetical protein